MDILLTCVLTRIFKFIVLINGVFCLILSCVVLWKASVT